MQLSSLEKNFYLLVSLATILRCHQFGIHREVREEREGERRERERRWKLASQTDGAICTLQQVAPRNTVFLGLVCYL